MDTAITAIPPKPSRPTQVRWLIFGLACATSWLLYLHRYSWGVIRPSLKKEYGLDDATLGWLDTTAFMVTYGFGQIPGGLAGDVFGPRLILSLLILLWSATVAVLGWTHGFWQFFGVRSVFGLAQAPAYPILSKITRSWFPQSIRTGVQGAVTASGRVGGAFAGLIIATLLMGELGLSWQRALFLIAGLGVLLSAAFWFVVRDNPREHPWVNNAERQALAQDERPAVAGSAPVLRWNRANAFNLSMFLLTAFASTFADNLYVSWIATFLKEAKGFSTGAMGTFTTVLLLGGAVGAIMGGVLSDVLIRRIGRRLARSAVGFTGKLLAAVLMVLSLGVENSWLAILVLLASKYFTDWSVPLVWGTVTDISGRAAGTVFGVVNTVGAVAAAVAGPVMGRIKQDYGWDALFFTVAGVYVVAAVAWLFIDCTKPLVVEPISTRP